MSRQVEHDHNTGNRTYKEFDILNGADIRLQSTFELKYSEPLKLQNFEKFLTQYLIVTTNTQEMFYNKNIGLKYFDFNFMNFLTDETSSLESDTNDTFTADFLKKKIDKRLLAEFNKLQSEDKNESEYDDTNCITKEQMLNNFYAEYCLKNNEKLLRNSNKSFEFKKEEGSYLKEEDGWAIRRERSFRNANNNYSQINTINFSQVPEQTNSYDFSRTFKNISNIPQDERSFIYKIEKVNKLISDENKIEELFSNLVDSGNKYHRNNSLQSTSNNNMKQYPEPEPEQVLTQNSVASKTRLIVST